VTLSCATRSSRSPLAGRRPLCFGWPPSRSALASRQDPIFLLPYVALPLASSPRTILPVSLSPWPSPRAHSQGSIFPQIKLPLYVPVVAQQAGVALVSGYSKNLVRLFLEADGVLTPSALRRAARRPGRHTRLSGSACLAPWYVRRRPPLSVTCLPSSLRMHAALG
jgi:hypothetical protein